MSILIGKETNLIVQGITGRQALMNTAYMRSYGTNIIAGTRPGKGGQTVEGIPVYDTVAQAVDENRHINASVIYVPPRAVKSAAIEAIDAGIKLVIIISERTPHQDVMELIAYSRKAGSRIIGPNSIGIISPGESVVGLIGARTSLANQVFMPGDIGVISRSGGQVTTSCFYLTKEGIGQSTALCIGGDAFVGTRWAQLLELFQKDDKTKAVVGYGEIGSSIEEEAATLIKEKGYTKPFIVYIAGKHAQAGQRFGHAGAIIKKGSSGVEEKKKILKEAGVIVVEHLCDIAKAVKDRS